MDYFFSTFFLAGIGGAVAGAVIIAVFSSSQVSSLQAEEANREVRR